jgi:uncharacterized protein
MTQSIMYHDGNRRWQDRFDSRRISDRLEEKLTRRQFSADDKAFIEGASYFFLATADAEGRPAPKPFRCDAAGAPEGPADGGLT